MVQLLCPLSESFPKQLPGLSVFSRQGKGNTEQETHTKSQPVTVTYYAIQKHQTSAGTDPQ